MKPFLLLGLVALTACKEPPPPVPPPVGPATVQGRITFKGPPPARRAVSMGDPECIRLHDEDLLEEAALVDPEGGLANVFVWIQQGVERPHPPPKESRVVDQQGCRFVPRVSGIQVGQTLRFRNSDPVVHNVYVPAKKNRTTNVTLVGKGEEADRTFDTPEIMVRLECHLHGWMVGHVGVLDHPFFSVTDARGRYSIAELPEGEYMLAAWHERYGTQTARVTLKPRETRTVDLEFKP